MEKAVVTLPVIGIVIENHCCRRETIDDIINANIYHLQYVSKFRYRKTNAYILSNFYYSLIDSRQWNSNLRLLDVGSINKITD